MIETNVGRGTTFSIDVDNREYWITAKHMFTGVKTGPAGVFTTKKVLANVLLPAADGDDCGTFAAGCAVSSHRP